MKLNIFIVSNENSPAKSLKRSCKKGSVGSERDDKEQSMKEYKERNLPCLE